MSFRKTFDVPKEVKANVASGAAAWRSTFMDRTRHQSLTRSIGSQMEDGTRGGPVVVTMDRTRQELEDKITSLQDEIKIKEAERKCYQDDHDKVCESWNTTKEELRMKEAELRMKDKMLEETKLAYLTEVKLKKHLEHEVERKEQERQAEHDKVCESWITTKKELRMKEAELKMKDKMLEEAKLDHLTEVKLKERLEREVQRKEQERQFYLAERDKVCESWITSKEELRMKEAELQMKDKMLEETKLAHSTEVKLKDCLHREVQKKEEERRYYQVEHEKAIGSWNTTKVELRMKEAELQMKDKMLEETKLAHSTEVKMKEHLQHEIEKKEEDRRYYQTERDKFYGYWKTAQEQLKIKEAELQMKDKMLEQKKLEHSTEFELKGCLQHEIEKKEDRQYYQTDHDKCYERWKTMQEQLKVKEAQLKVKEAQLQMKGKILEEIKAAHLIQVKSYEERLKNVRLEYDNYKNSHPEKHTGTAKDENNLWRDECKLTSSMNQMKAEHDDFLTFLQLEENKYLDTIYEETIKKFKNKHDEVLGTLKDIGETKKKEIQKMEETNNGRTENLAEYHDQACTDIQNQYGDIKGNNWSTTATLKLNEELTGMSGETGQLEITARQSGPPTQMSQGTFTTDPPTHDAKEDSMSYYLRRRNGIKKLKL